ncbi:tripartite tricarboxylate transporter TctB family protein [Litchfieldia salsa]|uniref:Tripartite tricarboxylate transporter TctB family protein n=1 Tax=Litchfieldia salsa TaxID=930152 RepID=A0A1H0WQK3_9BACI|nr:tripartite tricarboxylate transporter TctB family protein [Litchfieldia salsa]SDP92725.1 Tripartite tricarboxylate transporter TctB family protein [Litchfieldia salsa]
MLKDLLTIEMKFSEYHSIFPTIIFWTLIILGLSMLIPNIIKRIKEGRLTSFNIKFFAKNYDKVKFYGTLGLLLAYVFFLEITGFLATTIIFMFLITILFMGDYKRKALIVSLVNSVTTSLIVWYVFGTIFDITLP